MLTFAPAFGAHPCREAARVMANEAKIHLE